MLLDTVKTALRVTTSALDTEINGLIAAAAADLRLVGINIPEEITGSSIAGDPLIERAVILYCKAEFGYDSDAERFRRAYDYLKCALSLAGDYIEME